MADIAPITYNGIRPLISVNANFDGLEQKRGNYRV
jgi:hypothetical protein